MTGRNAWRSPGKSVRMRDGEGAALAISISRGAGSGTGKMSVMGRLIIVSSARGSPSRFPADTTSEKTRPAPDDPSEVGARTREGFGLRSRARAVSLSLVLAGGSQSQDRLRRAPK
jgi:hypothetical protein